MQMIVAGGIAPVTDELRAADADNPRGYFEFERVKNLRADKAWVDDARGKVVKVIHMLVPELPDDRAYRVVFLERDLREVVKSQSTMLARNAKAGGGLPPERLIAIYEQLERTKGSSAYREHILSARECKIHRYHETMADKIRD